MSVINLPAPLKQLFNKHYLRPIQERMPNDVYLTAYPKSGNTWMQNILYGLIYASDMRFVPDKMVQMLIPDVNLVKIYFRISETAIFKSHNNPDQSIKNSIHVVRDGRDCLASFYAMNKSLKLNPKWEDMVVNGKGLLGYPKWHIYLKNWIQNPFHTNILWIRYEDLLINPYKEVKKICEFLNIDRVDPIINTAIESSGFNEMRKKEDSLGWFNQNWDKKEKFIRRGIKGSYIDEVPIEYIKYFESEAKEMLEYFGYLD